MPADESVTSGSSVAPTQSSRSTEGDASADESDDTRTLAEDEDIGLAPRDWTIIQIREREDDEYRGVDQYLIKWARTRHPTADFAVSLRRGTLRVRDGDDQWAIVRHDETTPNPGNGEPEIIVEWADTWLTMWQLPSAWTAVVEFTRRNPLPLGLITSGAKPDLQNWPIFLKSCWDPESEPETDDGNNLIEDDDFEIEVHIDYTASFLQHCKHELSEGRKLASPAIASLLCMPVRQRLKFNPEYVRMNSTLKLGRKKWRVLPVYVVGLALRVRCNHCATRPREELLFALCVFWPGVFADACVNCVYAGGRYAIECTCRLGLLGWKDDARAIQLPDAGTVETAASSGDEQDHSVGARSSVMPDEDQNEDGVTPHSEHSSLVRNRRAEGRQSRYFRRRQDESDASSDTGPGGEQNSSTLRPSGESTPRGASNGSTRQDDEQSIFTPSATDAGLEHSQQLGTPRDESSLLLNQEANAAESSIEQSDSGDLRVEPDVPSDPDADVQGPRNASGQAVQRTDGRFGDWDVAGPSTRPAHGLSERQLSKRPVAPNDGNGAERSKRTRRTTRGPAADSSVHEENPANPVETFKVELTALSDRSQAERSPGVDASSHMECSRNPRDRCVDAIKGYRIPPYNKFHPPPGVVYAHEHTWTPGGLSDDNVKFIISWCPCNKTEFLHQGWQRMCVANPSNGDKTKYEVLSIRYSHELNMLIQAYCPPRPQWPGHVVQID